MSKYFTPPPLLSTPTPWLQKNKFLSLVRSSASQVDDYAPDRFRYRNEKRVDADVVKVWIAELIGICFCSF